MTSTIARRWPTWLALPFVAAGLTGLAGSSGAQSGRAYIILLVVAPAAYLFLAVAGRRRFTWPVIIVALLTVPVLHWWHVDPVPLFVGAAVTLGALGLIDGVLRQRPILYALQVPGNLGFLVLALVILALPADSGYADVVAGLVAIGLLGHAIWDAIHWRARKVISRTFAEWCGVFDAALGVGILITLLVR